MKCVIELPNDVKRNKSLAGTILISTEGIANFRLWNVAKRKKNNKYKRLPHGRVTRTDEATYLTLRVNHDESGIRPSDALINECWDAKQFLKDIEEGK